MYLTQNQLCITFPVHPREMVGLVFDPFENGQALNWPIIDYYRVLRTSRQLSVAQIPVTALEVNCWCLIR